MKEVILTGIRSNDEPTLGNYLGAFLPMVELQREKAGAYQLNMFVPDLHSFTTPIDHSHLYANTLKNLKYFVAAGLDIDNADTYIYRQSFVSAHSELTWILNCFTRFGEMSRMTQFKDKAGIKEIEREEKELDSHIKQVISNIHNAVKWDGESVKQIRTDDIKDPEPFLLLMTYFSRQILLKESKEKVSNSVDVGLFDYPVLMAADILLYGAQWVPVGDDQKQHLEITRDLAIRMNHKFGEVFTVPHEWRKQLEFAHRDNGVRIRSLTNPEKKMSKSISDPRGTILLSDDPEDAAKKVMGATTDSEGRVNFDWQTQPGITNLLQMLALLSGRTQDNVNQEWVGSERYGDLKKAVAAAVETFLGTFQSAYAAVDEDRLLRKLEADEAAMADVANETLYRVQQAVGLRPRA